MRTAAATHLERTGAVEPLDLQHLGELFEDGLGAFADGGHEEASARLCEAEAVCEAEAAGGGLRLAWVLTTGATGFRGFAASASWLACDRPVRIARPGALGAGVGWLGGDTVRHFGSGA